VEKSSGDPLISTRPFAVTKWSAWLVSKVSPCLSGSKPSYTKSATISCRTPCRLLLTDIQKNTRFTKTLCSQYCGKTKQTCRNACLWSSGECNGRPVSPHEPLDTTVPWPRYESCTFQIEVRFITYFFISTDILGDCIILMWIVNERRVRVSIHFFWLRIVSFSRLQPRAPYITGKSLTV